MTWQPWRDGKEAAEGRTSVEDTTKASYVCIVSFGSHYPPLVHH